MTKHTSYFLIGVILIIPAMYLFYILPIDSSYIPMLWLFAYFFILSTILNLKNMPRLWKGGTIVYVGVYRGQLKPDIRLGRFSAIAGGTPSLC